MKFKLASLVVELLYIPWGLFLTYLILTKIEASDLMWFLYWMSIPLAFIIAILSRLVEWED